MRKIKVFALLVVLMLMFTAVGFAEDSDLNLFEPGLTMVLELDDAAAAMEDPEMAALVTVCMALDLVVEDIDSPNLAAGSYIGRSEDILCFFFHVEGQDLVVVYDPSATQAAYMYFDTCTDDEIATILAGVCPDGFIKNDEETVFGIINALQEGLAN